MRNIGWTRLGAAGIGWLITCTTAAAQLTYVERSVGLNNPEMEEGETEFEFGDVNGDGHVDIVSIGDHGSPGFNSDQHGVMVWFGDGAGNWTAFQYGQFGYGGVALGDVDNDGLMDVGYGMHHNYSGVDLGNQLIEVALGDGTGQVWAPWDDGLAANGETWGMFGTDFADVDNDGDLDVGSVSFGGSNGTRIYLNNGDGTWTQSSVGVGGNSSMHFQFGEVNGDGNADFVAAFGGGTVRLGNGEGGFTLGDGNLPAPASRRGVALGDVNHDGRDDLAWVTSGGGLRVYSWTSPGVWQDLSGNLPAGGGFDLAQIEDMDLDGHGDVVAFASGASQTPGQIVIFSGDGAGNWQQIASTTTPDNSDYAAFRVGSDVDHNGYPDMVVVQTEEVFVPPFLWFDKNRPHCYAEDSAPASRWIYPKYPRGGEVFTAGSVQFIDWHTAVPSADPLGTMTIELSHAGPSGPWTTVALDVPNNGRYQWRLGVGLSQSSNCFLRYSSRGASAVTPDPFTIVNGGTYAPGDLDCSGAVDMSDVGPFVLALTDAAGYAAAYPDCDADLADLNGDNLTNGEDIGLFVGLLVGG